MTGRLISACSAFPTSLPAESIDPQIHISVRPEFFAYPRKDLLRLLDKTGH